MKEIKKLVLAILIVSVPALISAQDKGKETETVKYSTSIDCANCVSTIMTNLPHEKGIKDVKCDLPSKTVTVTYQKDKSNSEQIKKAIGKLGFTAKEVTTESPAKKN